MYKNMKIKKEWLPPPKFTVMNSKMLKNAWQAVKE
jgi:hypothetical protein